MIKTLVLAVIAMVVFFAAYLYVHLGLSRPVTVTLETRGPFTLVFADHVGPYHQILPKIAEVEAWAAANHLACPVTFGEYLDDPPAVDEDRLRSRGGCLFTSAPAVAPPAGFGTETRAAREYAVGHFAGSPAIGPYKVYPKVQNFLAEQRRTSTAPVLETYVVRGDQVTTEYLFAVDKSL